MAANFVYFTASQEWKPDVAPQDYRDGYAPVLAAVCLTRIFQENPDVLHGDWNEKAHRKLMRGGRVNVSAVELDPTTFYFQGNPDIFKKGLVNLFEEAGGIVKLYEAIVPQHDKFHKDNIEECFLETRKTELTMIVTGSMWRFLKTQNLV